MDTCRDFLPVIMADQSSVGASGSDKNSKAGDHSASGQKRQAISLETKVAIIK